jgi:hypothetical protein
MTMPDERYRSVKWTEQFLLELCDTKKTPRVPKYVRDRARALLRHYPSEYYMDVVATKCPNIFETRNPMDDVTMMILDYEAKKK